MNAPQEPKLTPEQMAGMRQVIARTVEIAAGLAGWNRTCLSCCHFNEQTELCGVWKCRPPARIIVEGCESWAECPF